jgi:hypothetical protein
MMPKIPLKQQIDAVVREIEQRKLKPGNMSRAEAEYHLARLVAAANTLQWLQINQDRIKGRYNHD